MPFGRPGVTFSDFRRSWGQASNLKISERFPEGARAEVIQQSEGKLSFRGSTKQLNS